MKAIKRHWYVGPLSYVLSLQLMLMPMILTLLACGTVARAELAASRHPRLTIPLESATVPHLGRKLNFDRVVPRGNLAQDIPAKSGDSVYRNQFSGIGGILASVLIGALIVSLAKDGPADSILPGAEVGTPTAIEVGQYDPTGATIVGGTSPGPEGVAQLPAPFTGENSGSAVLENYSPVAIHITANSGNIDPNLVQEYHVFRPDYEGEPLIGYVPNPPEYNYITVTPNPGQLAIISQGSANVDAWDDGADRPINYSTIVDNELMNVSSGTDLAVGTGIHIPLVGKRWAYQVEALLLKSNFGGSPYALTTRASTNTVTYLQPVLQEDSVPSGYVPTNGSWSVPSTGIVQLALYATLIADAMPDYILQVASSADFNDAVTLRPYDTGAIQSTAALESNPRLGPTFPFFNPVTGQDGSGTTLAAAWSALPDTGYLYARVGVRDASNGTDAAYNPYLFNATVDIAGLIPYLGTRKTSAPTISSFTPTSGPSGTSVTITGTNLLGATEVTFNGIDATTFNVVSANSVTATVPTDATTGKISITTAGGTATSAASFTVSHIPAITSFTPSSGSPGTTVTITGTNLDGATAVRFNGTAATGFRVLSATVITATVSAMATTGPVSVVTPNGSALSMGILTIHKRRR